MTFFEIDNFVCVCGISLNTKKYKNKVADTWGKVGNVSIFKQMGQIDLFQFNYFLQYQFKVLNLKNVKIVWTEH